MKKYQLNYAWNSYEKGYVFETYTDGDILINGNKSPTRLYQTHIDLLVLSGALTEIKEGVNTKACGHFTHCSCEPSEVNKFEIVPSERIDYCCMCKNDHGYDCPLDSEIKKIEPLSNGIAPHDWKEIDFEIYRKIQELVKSVNFINIKLK